MSEQQFKAGDRVKFVYDNEDRDEFHGTIIGGEAIIDADNAFIGFSDSVMAVETHSPVRDILSVPIGELTRIDPYADYPGGADQYREDAVTLTEAGALGDNATRGDWRWSFRHGTRYGDVITALESEASDGECFDIIELGGLPHMMIFSNADADLLVNAVNVARALSRYMPYALARLGGAS